MTTRDNDEVESSSKGCCSLPSSPARSRGADRPCQPGELPLKLDFARGSERASLVKLLPTYVARAVATPVGISLFSGGYAGAKMISRLWGSDIADSPTFYGSCLVMLQTLGIFPTAMKECPLGTLGGWGVEELSNGFEEYLSALRTTAICVSNHVSYLDAFIVPFILRLPKMMSMEEVRNYPIVGRVAEDLGTVWVQRDNRSSRSAAKMAITEHTSQWKTGMRPLLIFPEGTTTNGRGLAEFHKGAFEAGLRVLPVLIKYTGTWDPATTTYRGRPGPSDAEKKEALEVEDLDEVDIDPCPFSKSDWAAEFAGHFAHECVVLICRPYIPSPAEKADAILYAANVRKLMLARLQELHDVFPMSGNLGNHNAAERFNDYRREQLQKKFVDASKPTLSAWHLPLLSRYVTVTTDGMVARHLKKRKLYGVVFGNAPLRFEPDGSRIFEVILEDVKDTSSTRPDDPTGGLVLGLTLALPEPWEEKYEMGLDIPLAWSVGYEGLVSLADQDQMISVPWNPNSLQVGDRVGLRVSSSGGVNLILEREDVCKLPGVGILPGEDVYPFIDLLGTAVAVSLVVSSPNSDRGNYREG